jgi:hypothetical protein
MKTLFCFILIFTASWKAYAIPVENRMVKEVGPATSISDDRLEKLVAVDTSGELAALVVTLRGICPEGCPTIYSSWFCEELRLRGEKERSQHEFQVRAFGEKLLNALREKYPTVSGVHLDASEQRAHATSLVDLADWIAKGDGLGNALLTSRCWTLANVALANVIVTENSRPSAELKILIGRATGGGERGWVELIIRAHEHEVPGAVAPLVGVSDGKNDAAQLLLTARAQKETEIRKRATSTQRTAASDSQPRTGLPNELAIFVDDPITADGNPGNAWNEYRFAPDESHIRLANDLKKTCLFLEKVGSFPSITPVDQLSPSDRDLLGRKFYASATAVAFDKAWRGFSDRKEHRQSNQKIDADSGLLVIDRKTESQAVTYRNMHAGIVASEIYDRVKSGDWSDYVMGAFKL